MSNLTAPAGRSVRPGWLRVPFQRASIGTHDIRSVLPAALRAEMQTGFLERLFRETLVPEFVYGTVADVEPFAGGLGDNKTMTRPGIITPDPTPVTAGSDAAVGSYNIEQWSVTMDRYSKSLDTEMVASALTLQSKFLEDIKRLSLNAGQTLNLLARNKLYAAYSGGRSWVTTTATSDTTVLVNSVAGFGFVTVNGVLTPVSASNPLTVTIYPAGGGTGVPNTVTGVNTGTNALTLGTAVVDTVGQAIVAANAPATVRGAGLSAFDLTGSNTATFALFRAGVTRLRKMAVPTIGGYYVAHVDPDTESQLFADSDFKQALQGRVDSPIYRDLSIGRFGGIDWVRNLEAPTILGGTATSGNPGTLTVHRPVIMGGGALIAAPLEGIDSFLAGTGVEGVNAVSMVNVAPGVDVSLTVRAPQDRHGTTIASTRQWFGDYGVPTDLYAGVAGGSTDPALFKRAVVLEHS